MQQHITCHEPSWMHSQLPSHRWHLLFSQSREWLVLVSPGFHVTLQLPSSCTKLCKYKNGIIRCDCRKQEEQVKKQITTQLPQLRRLSVQWPVHLKYMWQLLLCQFPTSLHTFQSFIHRQRRSESDRLARTPISAPPTRRLVTSRWAATAGTQLRRTATLPLLRIGVEPGESNLSPHTSSPIPFVNTPSWRPTFRVQFDSLPAP